LIQIGATRQVYDGDSGASVFFNIRNGNGTFRTTAAAANTGTGIFGQGSVTDPTLYDKGQYTVRFIDPDNYEVLDATATVIATGGYQSGQSIEFQGIAFAIEGQPAAGDEFQVEPSRNQSVFQTIQNIVTALDAGAVDEVSRAAMNNTISTGIQELDVAIGSASAVRIKVGIRLNTIESQVDSNDATALLAKQVLVDLEDLDYAEALSRLSMQAVTLEAAQQSFVMTQQLSLFRFL
jgi:flagellar hook-associated protein 3 FlgL